MKQKKLILASAMTVLTFVAGTDATFANQMANAKKKANTARSCLASGQAKSSAKGGFDLAKGWEITSTGGLSFVHPQDDRYWFKLSGVGRVDHTTFMGTAASKGTQFVSGANLRALETYLDGGVGENWVYNLSLSLLTGPNANRVDIPDAYVSYIGLVPGVNNQLYIGQLSGNWFGLDNSNGTSWNPFLERSMGSSAFYPGDGLGVMTDFWWKNGGLTLIATQQEDTPQGSHDRFRGIARATVAPLHEDGNVWHFGVSGMFREIPAGSTKGAYFGVVPGARTRTLSPGTFSSNVLNTTYGNLINGTTPTPIQADYVQAFNVEMAKQYGPFIVEGEYTQAHVHRTPNLAAQPNFLGSLRFNAWNVQTRYLLTGESHGYDVRDGNFGAVKPFNTYGAVELAARYDYVNLNDKDVRGGFAHNATLGVNWFLNQQVRLSANYVRSVMNAAIGAPGAAKRNLDIIALRCQLRFK